MKNIGTNQKIKGSLHNEATRIDLVVTFGKNFDRLLAAKDPDGMSDLAAWAREHDLPDCGTQAFRAATALKQGVVRDAVPAKLAGLG